MSDKSIIELSDISAAQITIPQSVFDRKFELLGASTAIKVIADFDAQERASSALKNISALLKSVEDARKAVKAPVLELGRKIEELAKNFAGELESEKNRISRLLGAYIAEEERKRREAEQKAREEALKAQRAAEEEARKAREAAETAGKPAPAPKVVVVAPVSVAVAPVVRAAGVRMITTRKFEIIDVAKLHAAHPELFAPNESAIREFVKTLNPETDTLEGVKFWDEKKATA